MPKKQGKSDRYYYQTENELVTRFVSFCFLLLLQRGKMGGKIVYGMGESQAGK